MDYCPGCPRNTPGWCPGTPGAVGPDGALDAPILLVDMSPNKEELQKGQPLVGSSGHFVWRHGQDVGLFREMCRIVNVSSCWPLGAKGKSLSKDQIKACRPRLEEVLASWTGNVIVCLGADAFEAVTGLISWEQRREQARAKRMPGYKTKRIGIEQWRGYLIEPKACAPIEVSKIVKSTEHFYKAGGVCPACKARPWAKDLTTVESSNPEISQVATAIMSKVLLDFEGGPCFYCNGTGKRVKGDPKLEKVTVEIPRTLPPNVKWIIGSYHPAFIMRMGLKPTPAFVQDVGRAVRALKGELEIVEVQYETEVPCGSLHGNRYSI